MDFNKKNLMRSAVCGTTNVLADKLLYSSDISGKRFIQSAGSEYAAEMICPKLNLGLSDNILCPVISGAVYSTVDKLTGYDYKSMTLQFLLQTGASAVSYYTTDAVR